MDTADLPKTFQPSAEDLDEDLSARRILNELWVAVDATCIEKPDFENACDIFDRLFFHAETSLTSFSGGENINEKTLRDTINSIANRAVRFANDLRESLSGTPRIAPHALPPEGGLGLQHSIHAPSYAPPPTPNTSTSILEANLSPFERFVVENLKKMNDCIFVIESKSSNRIPSPPSSPPSGGLQHRTTHTYASQVSSQVPPAANTKENGKKMSTNRIQVASSNPIPITPKGPAPKPRPDFKTGEVRFVFRFRGSGPPVAERVQPTSIKQIIDPLLLKHAETNKYRLLCAKWNSHGNLVLSFNPGTNATAIFAIKEDIRKALKLPAPVVFSRDVAWSKVLIAGVPTGLSPMGYGEVYSEKQLREEILANNPFIAALNITQEPRWVVRPENLLRDNRYKSSVSFVFEDPEGSLATELVKQRTYMFANVVHPRIWVDKPVLKECTRCLALTHFADKCLKKECCDICGKSHKTSMHCVHCGPCRTSGTLPNEECPHPPRCLHCKGPHRASSPNCPERAKFRKPATSILSEYAPPNPPVPSPSPAPTQVGRSSNTAPNGGDMEIDTSGSQPNPSIPESHQPSAVNQSPPVHV